MRYTKVALLALLGMFSGCEGYYAEKDAEADGSTPFIAVSAPGQNSIYTNKEAIKIETLFSDKDNVKEIDVQIIELNKNGKGNKPVINFKKFPKRNPVVLDTAISAASLPVGNYLLIMNGIDGRTNVGTKEINFSIK